jgi:hypothetical protein
MIDLKNTSSVRPLEVVQKEMKEKKKEYSMFLDKTGFHSEELRLEVEKLEDEKYALIQLKKNEGQ